ncbi:hypothetical protein MRX96_028518 [Rhipicephalus microplus]
MDMTGGGKALAHRLLSLPDTGMGRSALQYASLISGALFAGLLPIPPHWDSRLPISIRVPGMRSKGHTPRAALPQETCAMIEERYSGHLYLYTDGSVKETARLLLQASFRCSETRRSAVFRSRRHRRPRSSRH